MRIPILAAAVAILCFIPVASARAQAVPTASIDLVRNPVAVGAATGGKVTLANKVPGRSYELTVASINQLLAFKPDCSDASIGGVSQVVPENGYIAVYACARGSAGLQIHTADTTTNPPRFLSEPITNINVLNPPRAPLPPSVSWNSGINPGNSYLYSLKFNITNNGEEWTGPIAAQMGTGILRRGGYLDSNARNTVITDSSRNRIPGSLTRLPSAVKQFVAYAKIPSGSSELFLYSGGENGANSATITSGLRGTISSLGLVRYTQNLEVVFDVFIESASPWSYIWRGAGFDILITSVSDGVIYGGFRVSVTAEITGFRITRGRFHRLAVVQTNDRLTFFVDGTRIINRTAPAAFARSAQPKNVDPWRSDEGHSVYVMMGTIEGGIGPMRIRDTVSNTTLGEWVFGGQNTQVSSAANIWSGRTPSISGGPAFTWQFRTRPSPAIDQQSVTISPIGVTDRGGIAIRSDRSGSASSSDTPDSLGLTDDTDGLFGLLGPLREGATRSAGGTAWLVMASLVSVGVGGRIMRASNSMLAAAAAGILVFAMGAIALGIPLVWTVVISISLIASSLIYTHAR